jgi:6-phosphofructokinase 1
MVLPTLSLEPEPYADRPRDSSSTWQEETISEAAATVAASGAPVGSQPSRADLVRLQRLQQIRQLKPRHETFSAVEEERRRARVPLPPVLTGPRIRAEPIQGTPMAAGGDDVVAAVRALFPTTVGASAIAFVPGPAVDTTVSLRIGCVLSGGQASGGHNVISGLFDWLKANATGRGTVLMGFLDGPQGIYSGNYIELNEERISLYRNQGGFDMIGSGRHKIHGRQFGQALKVAQNLRLDGIVVIGGDDSNTNAAMLGEYFQNEGCSCVVVGAPKTIDGDLKLPSVGLETSFGFDSACKCYSECIGNIQTDCYASQKYYHFVRLMGRSASHIALECALQCHPNMCLIGEEVAAKALTPREVATQIADMIASRAAQGKHYGTVLVPEGLIEFFPTIQTLITEINDALGSGTEATADALSKVLSAESYDTLSSLPSEIQLQLILDRDPHGNVQVSAIETEALLISMAGAILAERREAGAYSGQFPVGAQSHFLGYEGRSLPPTLFDSSYCYGLGHVAGLLIRQRLNGFIAVLRHLNRSVSEWLPGGVPLTSMMTVERRLGVDKPVIRKALVELQQEPFLSFAALRDRWASGDHYRNPGPIQYSGPTASGGNFTLASTDAALSPEVLRRMIAESGLYAPAAVSLGSFAETRFACEKLPANLSPLQAQRLAAPPECPAALSAAGFSLLQGCGLEAQCSEQQLDEMLPEAYPAGAQQSIIELVPSNPRAPPSPSTAAHQTTIIRLGVVFCGRQNPAGHNIVAGLRTFLRRSCAPGSVLIGFLNGTKGMCEQKHVEIGDASIAMFINQGGFDMLGRSSEQLHTPAQLAAATECCVALKLDGLVLVGGRHTLTDTAVLSEHISNTIACNTRVIAVPSSIERDIVHPLIETTAGFDTVTRVISSLIANIATDGRSAKKYWYFIRLPGRDTSHITLEAAARTQPNIVMLAEEVIKRGMNLRGVVTYVADIIAQRAAAGKHYGVFILPEGLISAIPEIRNLVDDINALMANDSAGTTAAAAVAGGSSADGGGGKATGSASGLMSCEDAAEALAKATPWSAATFRSFPPRVQSQLLLEREIHGTVQLSQIELERLLDELVGAELQRRKEAGTYSGSYTALCHYFGYQARSALPSLFDANLGYTLGMTAAALITVEGGISGSVAIARGLIKPVSEWSVGAVPVASLLSVMPRKARVSEVGGLRAVSSWRVAPQVCLAHPCPLPGSLL